MAKNIRRSSGDIKLKGKSKFEVGSFVGFKKSYKGLIFKVKPSSNSDLLNDSIFKDSEGIYESLKIMLEVEFKTKEKIASRPEEHPNILDKRIYHDMKKNIEVFIPKMSYLYQDILYQINKQIKDNFKLSEGTNGTWDALDLFLSSESELMIEVKLPSEKDLQFHVLNIFHKKKVPSKGKNAELSYYDNYSNQGLYEIPALHPDCYFLVQEYITQGSVLFLPSALFNLITDYNGK